MKYLYVSYYSEPYLTKINLFNLTRVGRITLPSNYVTDSIVIGRYMYIGRDDFPGTIHKIDLNRFSISRTLELPENGIGSGGPHEAFAIVGDTLYVGIDRPESGVNGGIVRVDLKTFTRKDRLNLTIRQPYVVTDGTYLYVGYFNDTTLHRLTLAPFQIDTSITLPDSTETMLVHKGYLYTSHGDAGQDTIERINLSTFTNDASLTLDSGEPWVWSMVADDTYLYCGLAASGSTYGKIVRVNLDTFTRKDALTIGLAVDIWTMFLYGGYLWAVTEGNPTVIYKIDKDTFTVVNSLSLISGEEYDCWTASLGLAGNLGNINIDQLIYQHCERMERFR